MRFVIPPQRPSSTFDSCGQRRFNRYDITDQIFDIGVSSSGIGSRRSTIRER